jgi:hypothetical protein
MITYGANEKHQSMSDRRPPRSPGRFKEREVARALRATRLAGETPTSVEVDPTTGKISVMLAKPGAEAAADTNEWDEVGQ